ncbi:hypothetical protein ACJMK2_042352 [Sinanodonta woodiana]|uniref:Fibronectin type-III domain-containing protein n=1 Tax=Sinanodonta woodiana TaxID=1069815 RepID=A0ABD3W842_SINWO
MSLRNTHVEWLMLFLMYSQIYCSSESEGSTGKEGLNVHSAPHNVKAVQVGKMDVLVTWEIPESHRIHNLTYRVFYAPVEDRIQVKSIDVVSSQEAIIGGLTQGKTYTIRVAAVSAQGHGHMSHPVTVPIHHLDDCLQCKTKEETSSHCNCSNAQLEETCKEVCRFNCRNIQGLDQTNGCKGGCITGWYGQYCNMSCPGMCLGCDVVSGHCITCTSHVTGPYCNETCPAGLHGARCDKPCPTHCNRCLNQSYCNECKTGRYGKLCEKLCHSDCLTCVDEPQKCTSCNPGKFLDTGNVCLNCKDNCLICTGINSCEKCKFEKYGLKCELKCPPNCVSCTNSDQCHKCVPNRYGHRCECNSKCRNVTEQCDTGEVCQKGCPPMKMGIYCSHSCPQSCYKCDQLTGACLTCADGLFGPNCDQTCGHCKRNKQGAIQCKKQTGKCDDCTSGWYGWRCNESCSIGCQTLSCDRFTGNCSPCKAGFHGPRCNETCSKTCYNVSITGCDKQSGYCIHGCTPGWYNEFCQSPCSATCVDDLCHQDTGVCLLGCVDGFAGDTCSLIIHREYLLLLDVRQIGAQNVLVQWDKFNFTDIELESVKKVVLHHKKSGTLHVDVHNVLDWKTKTHFILRDVDPNNKHTFQLLVLFELRSQSPILSKPVELELIPRASDELMIHLTADVEIYGTENIQEYDYRYGNYKYNTRCTRVTEESILNPNRYDKIKTQEIKCNVTSMGEVVATEITFFKDSTASRKLVVTDDKWSISHNLFLI